VGYTTSVAGTTITAAWANANVRDQVVTPFASTAARDSAITAPVEGMFAVITGDDMVTIYSGSAWVPYGRYASTATWTPTIVQGASSNVSKTVTRADYVQVGNICFAWFDLAVTGAGTSGGIITVSVPVTAAATMTAGAGYIIDATASPPNSVVTWALTSTTVVSAVTDQQSNFYGAAPVMALASGDVLSGSITYRTA
jgi:hypothetical protein